MAQAPPNPPGHTHADAYSTSTLRVSSIHELSYTQYGNPSGKPVIFLHGGPGGRTSKANTIFFSPTTYRVVLLDQRGCGNSRPNASVEENTTQNLVSDIEALRTHLQIPKWHLVFGGSWGSTLALAYAQSHPSSLSSLVLRGIFTVRSQELSWSFTQGANMMFPDAFEEFLSFLPESERANQFENYHKRLNSEDETISLPAAKAWNKYEISISTLYPNTAGLAALEDPHYLLAHARIEAHYFANKAFLEEGELLRKENIDKIRHIPTSIVQGRYDVVCPPVTAWDLHKAFPEARLYWSDDAGHSAMEPSTKKKLIEICDEYGGLEV